MKRTYEQTGRKELKYLLDLSLDLGIKYVKIKVGKSKNYGQSLFATKNIKKGEIVFPFVGPIVKTPTVYTLPISKNLYIDPFPFNNIIRCICHSCDPNCGIVNRSLVMAMRDIKKDEEITIDYAMFVYEYKNEDIDENRVCKCGSKICRGKLGSYKTLPESIKRKYKGFISDFLPIAKKPLK